MKQRAPRKANIRTVDLDAPIGRGEFAELLGLNRRAGYGWTYRDRLPPPEWDGVVANAGPVWRVGTLLLWAARTDRLRRLPRHRARADEFARRDLGVTLDEYLAIEAAASRRRTTPTGG